MRPTRFPKHPATLTTVAMCVATLLIALPVLHFSVNYQELAILRLELVALTTLLAVPIALGLYWILARIHNPWGEVILLSVALGAWLQPQWFPWEGPTLDGAPISTSYFTDDLIGELFLWSGVLLTAWLISRRFGRAGLARVAFVLGTVAVFSAGAGLRGISEGAKRDRLTFGVDRDAARTLSSSRNYFLIILDESQADITRTVLDENPQLAARFKDFVFFEDTAAGYGLTIPTFPLLMSGVHYANDIEFQKYAAAAYTRPDALYRRIKSQGYLVNVIPGYRNTFFPELRLHDNVISPGYGRLWESMTSLLNLSLFSSSPGPLKQQVHAGGQWLLRSTPKVTAADEQDFESLPSGPGDKDTVWIKDFLANATLSDAVPRFFSVHLHGGHVPWVLDREGYPTESRLTLSAYKDALFYKLTLLGSLLGKLERLGVYERTAVIIMGDHGSGRTEEFYPDRELAGPAGFRVVARANPLMMAKSFNAQQSAMQPNPASIAFSDFHTDIDALANAPRELAGRPNEVRRFVQYEWVKRLNPHLDGYREYLIAGKVLDDSSWWALHRHQPGFPEREACLFPEGSERYRFSRSRIERSGPNKILITPGDGRILLVKVRFESEDSDYRLSATVTSGDQQAALEASLASSSSRYATFRLPLDSDSDGPVQIGFSTDQPFQLEDALVLSRLR